MEVSKEDQQNINNFSKLNLQYHEYLREINQKKETLTQVEEAITEMDLADEDEKIKMKFGDCFFSLGVEESKELCEKHQQDLKKDINGVAEILEETKKKMGKLKATLYAKFGNSINLEED